MRFLPSALLAVVLTPIAARGQRPAQIARPPLALPSLVGPPPTGVAVTGTPGNGLVTWQPVAGAADYIVERWLEANPACCLVTSPPLGATAGSWNDVFTANQPYGLYRYRVTARYPNPAFGSVEVQYDRPAPGVPSGFSARHLGAGTVSLQWNPVAGIGQYRVVGSGVPNGRAAKARGATLSNVPAGPGSWQVMAVYPNGYFDPNAAASTGAMVRVLPSHSPAWLTKNNGPGNVGVTAVHHGQVCNIFPGMQAPCFFPISGIDLITRDGFDLWGDPLDRMTNREAVYANTLDLGVGRRTNCAQFMNPSTSTLPGFVTVCYATSHGPGPGELGFGDPRITTRAAAGEAPAPKGMLSNPWGGMPRSGSVIVIDSRGAIFLTLATGQFSLESDPDIRQVLGWVSWRQDPAPLLSVTLDSEGPKLAPHACLACHGGTYDVATNRVLGASLLPLDPNLLAFGVTGPGDRTRYERPYQEENIRRINRIVTGSRPSQAVVDYIRGLYNGVPAQAGAVAQQDYVPAGWAPQAGLYRQIVRPYCASCHLAAQPLLSFSSWANFQTNRARIYQAVCVDRSMPHSEIAFRDFWTKDTGPLYLPGLLAASLGYASCP